MKAASSPLKIGVLSTWLLGGGVAPGWSGGHTQLLCHFSSSHSCLQEELMEMMGNTLLPSINESKAVARIECRMHAGKLTGILNL